MTELPGEFACVSVSGTGRKAWSRADIEALFAQMLSPEVVK